MKVLLILVVAAISAAAHADQFAFDPGGGGSTAMSNIEVMDQVPGSGLAKGGMVAIRNFVGQSGSTGFTVYYQANLGAMQNSDIGNLFWNGQGGKFFTFTAGVGEVVTNVASNGLINFDFDQSNPVNFFRMYAGSTVGNNLTGAKFVGDQPIMSGHFSAGSGGFGVSIPNPVNFDQSPNGNQWPGQKTVNGGGGVQMTIIIDSVDPKYFPTLKPGAVSYINGSMLALFRQVDPSKCFNADTACPTGGVKGALGAVNGAGSGPDFQFQIDANQAITQ